MSAPAPPRLRDLPVAARTTIVSLSAAALVLAWLLPVDGAGHTGHVVWLAVILAVLCAGANLFEVCMPGNYSFQPNGALVFMAAALLPGWGILLVAVASFLPALILRRTTWFKAFFNAANYALGGLVVGVLMTAADVLHGSTTPLVDVTVLLIGAISFAVLNHLLIITVIWAAGERSLRAAATALVSDLGLDVALSATGATMAVLWASNPVYAGLAVGPCYLLARAVTTPLLKHQAETDSKTGLANFGHFQEEFASLLASASRSGAPLAVLMLDLDHLKQINDVEGHLTGDRAIRAISDVLIEQTPDAGLAARFGGEEFCVLLPGTSIEQATRVAERLRAGVAGVPVGTDDPERTITVTVSVGVACFPRNGWDVETLTKAADVAVYAAKTAGRDRVAVAQAGPAPLVELGAAA